MQASNANDSLELKQLQELKRIKNELIVDNLTIFDSGLQAASASTTTPAAALGSPIITFTTPNVYMDLFSIQLYWDSTFAGNFLYYLHIDTIQNLSTSTFRVPVGSGIDYASGLKVRYQPTIEPSIIPNSNPNYTLTPYLISSPRANGSSVVYAPVEEVVTTYSPYTSTNYTYAPTTTTSNYSYTSSFKSMPTSYENEYSTGQFGTLNLESPHNIGQYD